MHVSFIMTLCILLLCKFLIVCEWEILLWHLLVSGLLHPPDLVAEGTESCSHMSFRDEGFFMTDHKVLFLLISGGMRPSQAGPMLRDDILDIGVGPMVYDYKHDGCVSLNILTFGVFL